MRTSVDAHGAPEDEAACAMLNAEERAAGEGEQVTENEEVQPQQRDFTAGGPQAAEQGENTKEEGGEDDASGVDADEKKEDAGEGGEEGAGD